MPAALEKVAGMLAREQSEFTRLGIITFNRRLNAFCNNDQPSLSMLISLYDQQLAVAPTALANLTVHMLKESLGAILENVQDGQLNGLVKVVCRMVRATQPKELARLK
jgi:hypothetical protein